MRLVNFKIISSIELESNRLIWDMHNCAYFVGLELVPDENAAVMNWTKEYPWSGRGNNYAGLSLRFEGLFFLRIGPRDSELPLTEDSCVADLLRVSPGDGEPHSRSAYDWTSTDNFHLLFLFQSARQIEIGSEEVRLIPVE